MTYDVNSVSEYLKSIPVERQAAFSRLREVILHNLPAGFQEMISYRMPAYSVPLSRYPAGYHCNPEIPLPYISIASQKNFIAVYHMGLYAFPDLMDWFQNEYARLSIGKLDMGKSCIRLKNIKKIPYELLGEFVSKISVEQWIERYEKATS